MVKLGEEFEYRQGSLLEEGRRVPWPGQPDLYLSGITTEDSHIRAHVSPLERVIYVFQTKVAREYVNRNDPKREQLREAPCPKDIGGVCGVGWAVPWQLIDDIRCVTFAWDGWAKFENTPNTSVKGTFAVSAVVEALRCAWFPLWIDLAADDERKYVQLSGTDIVVTGHTRIQVKCDVPMNKYHNLFLQYAERNPNGKH